MRSSGPRSACLELCDRSSASSSTASSDLDLRQSGTCKKGDKTRQDEAFAACLGRAGWARKRKIFQSQTAAK